MNYFDELAEQFLKAENKRRLEFKIGLDIILAKCDNAQTKIDCQQQLNKPFIQTQGYNEFLEAELAIQNEVL